MLWLLLSMLPIMPNLMSMPFLLVDVDSDGFVDGLATLCLVDVVVYLVVVPLLCDVAMQLDVSVLP